MRVSIAPGRRRNAAPDRPLQVPTSRAIFCTLLLILAATPFEYGNEIDGSGRAIFLRTAAALVLALYFVVSSGASLGQTAGAASAVIVAYQLFVTMLNLSPTGFLVTMLIGSGLVVGATMVGRSGPEMRRLLSSGLAGYLGFHVVGFVAGATSALALGSAIDFHALLFPFSESRQGEFGGFFRATGFHIEPGTYSNFIYTAVVARALITGRLTTRLHAVAIFSTAFTFAAWAIVGAAAIFAAMAIETLVVSKLLPARGRFLLLLFLAAVLLALGPIAFPLFEDTDYVKYLRARFDPDAGSAQYKADAAKQLTEKLDFRAIIGQPLTNPFCELCVSPQDLGTVLNMLYYFGILPTCLVVFNFAVQTLRYHGPHLLIASAPLVVSKLYYYDPLFWLVLALGLWSRKIQEDSVRTSLPQPR